MFVLQQEIRRSGEKHNRSFSLHHATGRTSFACIIPCRPDEYDLIYADAWPGKFSHLDNALKSLRIGGIYFIDDLLPQGNWPEGHGEKVAQLLANIEDRQGFTKVQLDWASGLMMLVRVGGRSQS